MSDNFEWKTDEDEAWEETLSKPAAPKPPPKRPWRFILVTVVLLLGAFSIFRWQMDRQLEAVTQDVKADVLTTHNLIQRAVENEDSDLLRSLISGKDREWSEDVIQLVEDGDFTNPALLNWEAPAVADSDQVTITLAADLTAAELQSLRSYAAIDTDGEAQTVRLRHTAVYRQGKERWLLAPAEFDFWGNWHVVDESYVTLTYPQRDEALALRLAADLDKLVADICRTIEDIECAEDFAINLRFEKDVDYLVKPADPKDKFRTGVQVRLPAPSLIGWPVDEVSYQALYRVYGERLATAAITQLVAYECCRWALLYQGMLDEQLQQVGLRPPVLTTTDYGLLFNQQATNQLSRLFSDSLTATNLTKLKLAAFIRFLQSESRPGISLVDMQRTLNQQIGFTTWLNQFTDKSFDANLYVSSFLNFVFQQSEYAQSEEPPIPLPSASLQLICDGDRNQVGFYSYNFDARAWTETFTYDYLPTRWAFTQKIFTRPNSYLIVDRHLGETNETEYVWVEDNQVMATFELGEGEYYFTSSDPNGNYLLFTTFGSVDNEQRNYVLVDAESCRSGECRRESYDKYMLWSPDGQNTLQFSTATINPAVAFGSEEQLHLADESGKNGQEVEKGQRGFWLDDETFAYFRVETPTQVKLVTRTVDDDEFSTIISSEVLRQLIPEAERPETLWFNWGASIQDPSLLFVQLISTQNSSSQIYYFYIWLNETLDDLERVRLIDVANNSGFTRVGTNPNWIVKEVWEDAGRKMSLVNWQTEEEIVISNGSSNGPNEVAWSDDGRWFLVNQDNYLLLNAPDYDYRQLVFHDFEECYQAYWLYEE